jgi:hypothetical protein
MSEQQQDQEKKPVLIRVPQGLYGELFEEAAMATLNRRRNIQRFMTQKKRRSTRPTRADPPPERIHGHGQQSNGSD